MSRPAHCVGLKSPNGNWNSVSSRFATAMAALPAAAAALLGCCITNRNAIAVSHAPAATAMAAWMAGATKAGAMPKLRCQRERSHAEHPREVPGVAAQGGGTVDVARVESKHPKGPGSAACAAWWRSVKPARAIFVGAADTDDDVGA